MRAARNMPDGACGPRLRAGAAILAAAAALLAPARGQAPDPSAELERRLEASLAELSEARRQIADEKIPLAEQLARLERDQIDARKEYDAVRRQLDSRNLDLNNLRAEIRTREQEKNYLSNLLGEYIRNLEARLHIAELALYEEAIEAARLAPDNSNLKPADVYRQQVEVVEGSIARLDGLVGGVRFEGRAAGGTGLVRRGAFVHLGPVAYFASGDGALAGVAEQRLGSLEPSVETYADPRFAALTRELVADGRGQMPFDGSLGNARKVEETRETLVEHIRKGGVVMYPILGLAGLALLVALSKWLALSLVRTPAGRQVRPVFAAVGAGSHQKARTLASRLPGPAGAMLRLGAEHLGEPKDLIEEVMFEKMLDTRFRLQRALPFIAVTAACAPLLGLLGTVTGIINTFKLITVFGSGDVKMLSAGISEALITTEYGLYVAIPSVLFHSFLSRKAKTLADRMERLAIEFLNAVAKSRAREEDAA